MKISVIIIHWKTPRDLKNQISNFKHQKDLEIIVVDNNSDKTGDLVKCFELIDQRKLTLIKNSVNKGFATACNQGAKAAKGDWLLFLNPDTQISSSGVQDFVKKAEQHNFDAASPQQAEDNYFKPLPTWLSLSSEFSPLRRLIPLSRFTKHTLFGGCLLIRTSVLRRIGGWDQDFFLWFEDSDLTKRLYDNNASVGWVPVNYKHVGGSSFKRLKKERRLELFFHSMNLYAKKHFSLFGQLVVKLLTLINV